MLSAGISKGYVSIYWKSHHAPVDELGNSLYQACFSEGETESQES